MSHIKCKNTKPEIMVRHFLYAHGFRYQLHRKDLPGKPDIVLPKYKTVIFINACFWHGHSECKYAALPETNRDFWQNKISENIKRDKATYDKLSTFGLRVKEVWQCQLIPKSKEKTLNNLINEIRHEER